MITLAVIPARTGSKAIPKKNIRVVGGKPLIGWTIEAALEARGIDRVLVSTDSHEIAEVARSLGAEVPFLRPEEISQDDTPGIEPIIHAVLWCKNQEAYEPDYVMCLQPTSPFRTSEDIDKAINLAKEKNADSIISVVKVDKHPNWMQVIDSDGKLRDFITGGSSVQKRQDMEPVYALNGAIYLIRRDILMSKMTFFVEDTYAYIMPPERSIDIDTSWEMHLANVLFQDNK
jgi:N-acylneuraminate cytidylyltransferase/CMP-N,N'-diacetyllegionaminic acid synthase